MTSPLRLFEAFGVEIEYMIVERETLRVLPVADKMLSMVAGGYVSEVEMGRLCWSNELCLHVIELKTNGPARELDALPDLFGRDVERMNDLLGPLGGCLLPTAMHPTMNPVTETKLWPHDNRDIYQAFDRIFDCKGHGWSNLQSVHLNLPFSNDAEFGDLHGAIRMVLPLIPALAASSPLVEGRLTGVLDNRLDYYRTNCRRLPAVTGAIIPEQVFSQREYEAQILERIAGEVRPFDVDHVLEPLWVNARGAIARFDRGSIEIRLTDTQERPLADIAILAFVAALVRALTEARWTSHRAQRTWPVDRLRRLLDKTVAAGSAAIIDDIDYVRALGGSTEAVPARRLLADLMERLIAEGLLAERPWLAPLAVIVEHGCLAERIRNALDVRRDDPTAIETVYRHLAECLARGRPFTGIAS